MVPTSRLDLFVGRDREMAEVRAALEDALAGRGGLVMLVGEPGIGKTRTAEELAAGARRRGAEVLWGNCPEERGAPPYWPWVQVIRTHVASASPEVLRAELGKSAGVIVEAVPEMVDLLPGVDPAPRLEDMDAARFRLFETVSSFIRRAASTRPVVIVLDNLHWADASSLRLLEYVAQAIETARLLIVCIYRDTGVDRSHPLLRSLGELTRQRRFVRVLLRGLVEEETCRVMENVGGFSPPAKLVADVQAQTEGNPLFVREVMRLLAQEGMLDPQRMADLETWRFRIPEGVRELIVRRLAGLSERCNELLTVAAVVGREFHGSLLARLVEGATADSAQQSIEEALQARVVDMDRSSPGSYRFSHNLIQRTLADEVPMSRRTRLHGAIAAGLEALYDGRTKEHAAELAHHFAAAGALGAEKVVQYSRLAGEQAMRAYAFDEAVGHFQLATAAIERQPMGAQKAELLVALAHAQYAASERHERHRAAATVLPAFDYYVETRDVERAMGVALGPLAGSLTQTSDTTRIIAGALTLVPASSREAGRLLARQASALLSEHGDAGPALTAIQKALDIAGRERDRLLQFEALLSACNICQLQLRWQESLDVLDRAFRLARRGEMPDGLLLVAHRYAVLGHVAVGEPARANEHSEPIAALARESRFALVSASSYRAILAIALGDWGAARALDVKALATSPGDVRPLLQMTSVEYQTGDFAQGRLYLGRLLETMHSALPAPEYEHASVPLAIGLAARITGAIEYSDAADEAAKTVLSSGKAVPSYVQNVRAGLALIAAQRGDVSAAEEQYAAMESYPRCMSLNGQYTVDRVLGLLAQTTGKRDLAAAHFEAALAFCRTAGYRPELAWACHDFAAMILEASRPDRHKANALLDEGEPVAAAIGMKPLAAKFVGLRQQMAARGRGPEYPDRLTEREVGVLRLVVVGKTDKEIAAELVISARTVGNHVSSILSKTRSENRAAAATYAVRKRLTP